jgi:branched-chain amino acid transport system permease protein
LTPRLQLNQHFLGFAVFTAAVLIFPLVFRGSYEIGIGVTAGALAVSAVGFVLLIGYAHQLALGQAAFCMIGGYGNALLVTRAGWDPFVAMLASMLFAMLIAYALGKPILKLRGFILGMASLALQLMMIFIALEYESLTGGAIGVNAIPQFSVLGLKMGNGIGYYYFVWAVVAISVLIGLNIDRSRIGRALRAIGATETAAMSAGIDVNRYKLQMFAISAAMASVSGSLLVHYVSVIEPHLFGFQFSLNIITAVIAGGLMSIWGGVIGATLIVALREVLREIGWPLWEAVIMGALTVLVLIYFPRGLAGFIEALFQRHYRRAASQPSSGTELHIAATAAPYRAAASAMDAPLLAVRGVSKSFGNLRAVNGADFDVACGSITALIGPNGAGKTTLFHLVSGYLPLGAGTIHYAGRRIDKMLPDQIARLGIGRTFQNLQLFENMTVLENVMTGRQRKSRAGVLEVSLRLPRVAHEERLIRERAEECLAYVGLAGALHRRPSELPFGHQRLVEIARALALEPALLLMDEPASGLNDTETEQVAELILHIRAMGTTVLLVEHDIRLVMGLADRIVVMNYGEKIADGQTDEVRCNPQVVAAYLGASAQ